ncbi:DUF6141 family protein [Sediminicola arcticus]|jgi:hypothetical protein|uniref:DUF6141 family protein n=1 Tax=Sediminicola arcticus TaxID=1574308 RepID=A0ABV2SXF3_9FLAO
MRVFQETQRFNQWYMRLISLGLLAFLLFSLYQWFIAKDAVGNVPPDDSIGQLVVIFVLVLTILLLFLIQLKTEIDERGVHYRFIPFHFKNKTITWGDIKECYVRTYSPIMEYGGWGYRLTFKNGKAFNVSGNEGIQLVLKSGKKILIGTQKESEAMVVITKYKKNERI